MGSVPALKPRKRPRVTFSSLVDILSSPAHRLVPLLQAQKYPQPGPVFGYKKAAEQLVRWLHTGVQPNPNDPGLRDHESLALFGALAIPGAPSALLPAGANAVSIPTKEPAWTVGKVEISVFPDLLVHRKVGRKVRANGAAKLYFRKDPLTTGPALAALLYFHRSQVLGDSMADPSLCAVTDVQSGLVYTATGSYQRLLGQVQNACKVIESLWPSI
jgi:hypothetical protein